MEITLGKRIAEHRKRLGLTQDALAEKLGITAQAVSKWENDQSCPDIAMLPKLAEIFGISIDELLGREAKASVHEAEIVREDGDEGIFNFSLNTDESEKGKWSFVWDTGRKSALGFACWVLLLGVLLMVDNLLQLDAGFWSLVWPSFLLVVLGLFGGNKFSFARLGFVVLGGYFLVDNLGFMPLELGSGIIWPALVILFGLSLLMDAIHKPKKSYFRVARKGGNNRKTQSNYQTTGDRFSCDLSFGENTHLVKLPVLSGGEVNVSFGELTIDLSGCQSVSAHCLIEANCSFGVVCLLVPKQFAVQPHNATALGNVSITGEPDEVPAGTIQLNANASFGNILVEYIS